MSLNADFPRYPATLTDAQWQKKKGIAKAKKTGIGAALKTLESAHDKIDLSIYSDIAVDTDSLDGAKRARKRFDTGNKVALKAIAECKKVAALASKISADFKKSKLIPKKVREYVDSIAKAAQKLADDISKHTETVDREIDEAINEHSEDDTIRLAKEKMKDLIPHIDAWDRAYDPAIDKLETGTTVIGEYEKEFAKFQAGNAKKTKEAILKDYRGVKKTLDGIGKEMITKKAMAVIKRARLIRDLNKKVKKNKAYLKEAATWSKMIDQFYDERTEIEVQLNSLLTDVDSSISILEKGLKNAEDTLREFTRIFDMFNRDVSPTSVAKTDGYLKNLKSNCTKAVQAKKTGDDDALQQLSQSIQGDLAQVEASQQAMVNSLKIATKMISGRFAKNPMISTGMKKLKADTTRITKALKTYQKVESLLAK